MFTEVYLLCLTLFYILQRSGEYGKSFFEKYLTDVTKNDQKVLGLCVIID